MSAEKDQAAAPVPQSTVAGDVAPDTKAEHAAPIQDVPGTADKPSEKAQEASQAAAPHQKAQHKIRIPFLGQRSQSDQEKPRTPASPLPASAGAGADPRRVTFEGNRTSSFPVSSLGREDSSTHGAHRSGRAWMDRRRSSIDPRLRPEQPVYHDSRAATRAEYKRRATTLQDYYRANPTILPQLPFTFRHGFKRWKLGLLILFMIIDACVIPIILYYALTFGGNVQGWITFAIVTAIWGGPAYVEFAIRSWRLIKKERFYRPLGTTSRWGFDITNWIFTASITATTAFLIVGAAPHIVWIRILALPGPALLLVLGGCLGLITIFSLAGWKAPFRISSTAKGEKVHPGVYYMVEDIIAVNAAGGLPFREGFAARYEASPVFRKMLRDQSIFWSVGAVSLGIALVVIVCVHSVKKEVAYGVGKHTLQDLPQDCND